jgi:hypothetical protein
MAFDEKLAMRLRAQMGGQNALEKKMFGGIAFLVGGKMVCGVHGQNLVVRVGAERYEEILTHPQAKPFDMTGHPMTGWVEILPAGCARDGDLAGWVRIALEFVSTLPAK